MNWKLVFQLSLFGLAMGFASVFVIPANIEPAFWLVIFLVSAYLIARRCAVQRFQHGLYVGIANAVWITIFHMVFIDRYLAKHAQEAAIMRSLPLGDAGFMLMAMIGSASGVLSGVVIGVLAFIAGKVLPKNPGAVTSL